MKALKEQFVLNILEIKVISKKYREKNLKIFKKI